ncbi:TetR/AcrR family transcriptional regulator [Mycolicibacterium sp. 018/SC-01/001]|uniref:TetR/AcrR family transcriptional regulator n=1 Tax=Mycolicibacterium sp. 018/SC-01/001 TaxID=2592069 RepID=UPI00117DB8E4|nr:TetR/AcrR family transcriptional regulator [Mycolicibacterium sp. 018/SC-01/001]TRW87771.1 TetR/AcrR family transcriptional regulator [Mycolicibacterium sp. 018/SC-01/001]
MGAVGSRELFFQAGFDVLAEAGYGGLKLAAVCQRLGVTSGSFYHYFASWSDYTQQLVVDWQDSMTARVEEVGTDPDPRRRLDRLMKGALALPHGAEAAIRVWGSIDFHVRDAQAAVDRHRFDAVFEAALQVLGNRRQAELFASWSIYLLVGYEQALLPRNPDGLEWLVTQMLESLDAGRFASVPDGD